MKDQLTEADEGMEAISTYYSEWVDSLEKEVKELRQQLEASQKLSEERRVILALKYNPYIDGRCRFCFGRGHTDNCDYIRLIKEH